MGMTWPESWAAGRGNLGFLLPPMGKDQLFRTVMTDGVLPRKTFSMGEAQDKRYYLEAQEDSMKIQEQAPAKINLALDILGRRPDGYHELRMVMQAISLCDTSDCGGGRQRISSAGRRLCCSGREVLLWNSRRRKLFSQPLDVPCRR